MKLKSSLVWSKKDVGRELYIQFTALSLNLGEKIFIPQ